MVRTHPVTGKKALYVNQGFTRYINGIPRDESNGILRYLYEHMANPLFQCRFRWQENSIAFWDNRCVQHHAMWDYWPHTRSGNRVTVKGDRPIGAGMMGSGQRCHRLAGELASVFRNAGEGRLFRHAPYIHSCGMHLPWPARSR